ncbi:MULTISPECIES: hypothetical protein [Metallosphaera]|uniref:VapB-type antitoxin n=3 Tax=Metallosphaera TaxID=41980 RepID=A4YG54_METS5|nr:MULTISPECIES: hypothetical protein [Metallosphaera]ABP95406.1 hypothetical protein Msed_1246 [Metallosphaera sedula DSM 5348]AIM27391.1 hypothetical protein HA72_1246 [Metallosphaera sedula]AKV74269.1 hypothetical protein MsedA_1265 [Metallosphaera sedula]AKV76508.1 hypothetical protein MsedB_1267 [Metallosphaera sedula]AKV78760.1 hypothetical protein MsedC_1265 [Metallosphaera sedula]
MRKTLVRLDENIYRELVRLSLKEYGNTRHISDVLNELLRKQLAEGRRKKVEMKISVKVEGAENLTPEEIDRLAEDAYSGS